jgi:hypothetical protein
MTVAGEARWVALEDVALMCRALELAPPDGVPEAFLPGVADVPRTEHAAQGALIELLGRWCRSRGPFAAAELFARYALECPECCLLPIKAQLHTASKWPWPWNVRSIPAASLPARTTFTLIYRRDIKYHSMKNRWLAMGD